MILQNWTAIKYTEVKLPLSVHLHLFTGQYLYIEASYPRKPGDNAKLYSPALQFSSNLCLEFYYHMFGAAIGGLNVIINEAVVFSARGDKGDMWYKASINVSAIVGVHKVCHEFRMSYFCVSSDR